MNPGLLLGGYGPMYLKFDRLIMAILTLSLF